MQLPNLSTIAAAYADFHSTVDGLDGALAVIAATALMWYALRKLCA